MAFSRYNRDRPFLVIYRSATPSVGENTSAKDWGKTGKWKVDEEILIVDRINDKHMVRATVIIDILQRKMIKNRFVADADDNTVLKHYLTTYNDQVADGLQTWMRGRSGNTEETKEMINNLQEELDKIGVEITPDDK